MGSPAIQKSYHRTAAQEPRQLAADDRVILLTGRTATLPGEDMRRDELAHSIDGFALWLATEGRPKARGTIRNYCEISADFAAWCRLKGIRDFSVIGRPEVRAFIQHLRERGCLESTLATRWYALKSLFRYLAAEEWDGARPSPMDGMAAPEPSQSLVPVLSTAELKAVIAACSGSPRDEAIVRLIADTGIRISELAGIRMDETDLSSPARILVHGKGKKDRYVYPGGRTVLALRRYLRQRGTGPGPLWLSRQGPQGSALTASRIRQVIQDRGRQAGITGLHPHMFRHAWAHHFRADGGKPDDLCHLAGWSSMQMALRYGRSAAAERAEMAARSLSLGDRL